MRESQIYYLLERLLDILIEEKEFDLIVPTARRGVDVLRLSSQSEKLFKEGKIVFYDSIFADLEYLKGKRIVIFDESVSTGSGLTLRRDALLSVLSNNDTGLEIRTAALLIRGEPSTKRPDIEIIYRDLKQNMQRHGDYHMEGNFFYRDTIF
jgi:hypothetical protein